MELLILIEAIPNPTQIFKIALNIRPDNAPIQFENGTNMPNLIKIIQIIILTLLSKIFLLKPNEMTPKIGPPKIPNILNAT